MNGAYVNLKRTANEEIVQEMVDETDPLKALIQ